jgi:hypothetical protein
VRGLLVFVLGWEKIGPIFLANFWAIFLDE